jgi:hypothetical protein
MVWGAAQWADVGYSGVAWVPLLLLFNSSAVDGYPSSDSRQCKVLYAAVCCVCPSRQQHVLPNMLLAGSKNVSLPAACPGVRSLLLPACAC